MRRQTKENVNLMSLVTGILFILIGLGGTAIIIPTRSPMVVAPILFLIIGAILALIGGLRKWG